MYQLIRDVITYGYKNYAFKGDDGEYYFYPRFTDPQNVRANKNLEVQLKRTCKVINKNYGIAISELTVLGLLLGYTDIQVLPTHRYEGPWVYHKLFADKASGDWSVKRVKLSEVVHSPYPVLNLFQHAMYEVTLDIVYVDGTQTIGLDDIAMKVYDAYLQGGEHRLIKFDNRYVTLKQLHDEYPGIDTSHLSKAVKFEGTYIKAKGIEPKYDDPILINGKVGMLIA